MNDDLVQLQLNEYLDVRKMNNISTGICKLSEYDSAIFYRAECGCSSEKHSQSIELSYEEDINDVMLTIWSTIWTHYDHVYDDTWQQYFSTWWKSQKNKWSKVFTLVMTGQVEAENEFIFETEEQIQDYIDALQYGLDKVRVEKYSKYLKD